MSKKCWLVWYAPQGSNSRDFIAVYDDLKMAEKKAIHLNLLEWTLPEIQETFEKPETEVTFDDFVKHEAEWGPHFIEEILFNPKE